ncbi:MAG TPA: hypothetical protein DHV86_04440 [Methylophilaceae bacterium]|nr:hypothetical protein [Methylophilaceae bacterium]
MILFGRHKLKKVWLWDDCPGRCCRDLGIDLICQHTNEEIWAVQAKCYNQNHPVTKKDMD